MTTSALVASERFALVEALALAGATAPTLCEGWETRHLLAHLLLRETKPDLLMGMAGGPFAQRTEKATQKAAESLLTEIAFEQALDRFSTLPGYFSMHKKLPTIDEAMNLIEYFVHTEDVRRATLPQGQDLTPRVLADRVQEKIWQVLRTRAKLMASKKYPNGLVLEAPGYSPAVHAVIAPPAGQVATVLTGEPGELVLHLFGRESAALVEVS